MAKVSRDSTAAGGLGLQGLSELGLGGLEGLGV